MGGKEPNKEGKRTKPAKRDEENVKRKKKKAKIKGERTFGATKGVLPSYSQGLCTGNFSCLENFYPQPCSLSLLQGSYFGHSYSACSGRLERTSTRQTAASCVPSILSFTARIRLYGDCLLLYPHCKAHRSKYADYFDYHCISGT